MECAVYALEGVGWNELSGGWKALLMGNGTMVCGDMLMFNHKWPPMLVLTSTLHYSSLWLLKEFIALFLLCAPL